MMSAPVLEIASVGDHGLDADRGSPPPPLAATIRRRLTGRYPIDPFGADPLLVDLLGFPVIPVAVLPGGPLGLPVRPWRVLVGEVVETETDAVPGDTLVAAELAERVRDAVRGLLAGA